MSESSGTKEPGERNPQGRRNGETNGSHSDPPSSEANAVDNPERPAAAESGPAESDRPDGHGAPVGAWGLENGSELTRLLNDAELMDMVVSAMIENSKTVDYMAQELAAKLREALVRDDDLREWLIDVLIRNDKFRRRLAKAMAKSID